MCVCVCVCVCVWLIVAPGQVLGITLVCMYNHSGTFDKNKYMYTAAKYLHESKARSGSIVFM